MRVDRDLAFKGSRTYLHSTTVFDDLLRLQGEPSGALDFRFDRRTDRQVRYQTEPPSNGGQVASWLVAGDATLYVVERDEPITQTVPYDEDGLASRFTFADRHVALPARIDDYSLIEAIVAGYKALLLRTVAAPGARLAFVRLRLARMPSLPLEIHFSRRIGEFFQGDIRVDGESIGQIFFGEWR